MVVSVLQLECSFSCAKEDFFFVSWVHWRYTPLQILLMRQLWLSRHFALSMQLQVLFLVMVLGLIILQLCELITVFIFGMQLQLIFVFLLNILWIMLCGKKYLRNKGRKCFPNFVATLPLYSRLNPISFL